MAVGLTVKYYWYQIGTGDFLHSFFSTIAYNLEDGRWGTKYPVFMNELYSGILKYEHLLIANEELNNISNELKGLSIDKVIWDINDLTKPMPWGKNISPDITDLSNYFVTSDGEDLITIIHHAIEKAIELSSDIIIKSI
ncbi:MAG: immunity 70 family protein [Eubacterium sp.]|nr:immunity 70 family protein [Eubacterium sp.]